VLDQCPALVAYFTSRDDVERAGKIKRAIERLNDPLTKLSPLFPNFILSAMNDSNKLFQADEMRISYLSRDDTLTA